MSFRLLVLNGPNLNLLGTREPEIYGHDTLADVEARCHALLAAMGGNHELVFRQSNHEGELVTWIQQAIGTVDGIMINAGAYTHTSVAIHDALRAYQGQTIELHISNPHLREPFRHVSYVAPAVDAVIAGLGVAGYEHGLEILVRKLGEKA